MAGDQQKFQVAMTHAERFSQQQNWTEAIKAYRFALAEFPNNEAAIVGFGRASLFSGQTQFAERAFQQALKINPTNYEALTYLGEIQEQAGQVDAAAETYLRVGNIYSARMDIEAALDFWRRTILLVPHHFEAHRRLVDGLVKQEKPRLAARELLSLAGALQARDQLDEAAQQIQAIEQLTPGDPGIAAAYEALQTGSPIDPEMISETPPESTESFGDAFASYGDDGFDDDLFSLDEGAEAEEVPKKGLIESLQQQALTELAGSVFEDSDNPEHTMLIVQAIDMQGNGNLKEAANNYQQVAQGGMQKPALLFNLGLLWKELGRFDQAVRLFTVSQQDRTYMLGSQLALGQTYQATGKLDSALQYFVQFLRQIDLSTVGGQQSQQLGHFYENLGNNLLNEGDISKINTFLSTVSAFFSHPSWEKKLIEARQIMDGVTENGVMSLAEFLETPQTEVVVTAMALTNRYLNRNLLMTASEETLRAIQLAPDYLPLHLRLADILLKQGHTDQAISKYLNIAKVYQMRKASDDAVEVYRKILRLAPMDVTVRTDLINSYIAHNKTEQALDEYLILANSYYQLAQVDKAIEKYNQALTLTNEVGNGDKWRADILGRMGDIYNQRFDWSNATSAYEELLKIRPNDENVQRRLIDFYFKQNKAAQAIRMLDKLMALYQRQNPMKTVDLLKEFSSSRPDDMYLRQRMAIAYAQNGLTREAIAEYDALGEMQLEKGMRDEAVQTIQAIINLGPDDLDGYKRLLNQIK